MEHRVLQCMQILHQQRRIPPPRNRPRPMTYLDHLRYEHHSLLWERQNNARLLQHCSFCVRVLEILADTQRSKPENDRFICCQECVPCYQRLRQLNGTLPERIVAPPAGRRCRYCLLRGSLPGDIMAQDSIYHVCPVCRKMLVDQNIFSATDFVSNKYIQDYFNSN